MVLTPIPVTDVHPSTLPMYRRLRATHSNPAEDYIRVEYEEFLVTANTTHVNLLEKVFVLKDIPDGYQAFTNFLSNTAHEGETQLQFLGRLLAQILAALPANVTNYFEIDQNYINR